MKEYTLEQRREYARNLPTADLMHFAEIYNENKSTGGEVGITRDIINAEVERRINNWEVAEV